MAVGRVLLEKLWRIVRTVYVVAVMVTSLLVLSLPVLVAIGDVLVPCVLISRLMCVRCYSFEEHMARYSFRSSLMDVPVVSVIRSLIITCMCFGFFRSYYLILVLKFIDQYSCDNNHNADICLFILYTFMFS
ncbi:hypothetical protein HanOQP8_Chr12g0437691 [Helianthus annuus]|nr:hypothetical protein HanOQP8_Chr12g0437691 [Helianthus annuus]